MKEKEKLTPGTSFGCYHRVVPRELRPHSSLADGSPADRETSGAYTRKDVLRLLKIDHRELRNWEKMQLVPELEHYRFSDLLALKRIARLRSEHAPPRLIREAQRAVSHFIKDSPHLGSDVQVYTEGRRVRVQIGKHRLEPSSGQFLFDFAEEEICNLLELPASQSGPAALAERVRRKLAADQWFERGLELEQTGAPYEQIIEAYTKAAELDPNSAGAAVNLGTVFFNGHAWSDAERQYKRALEIDPNYALAHFNLGNLYDEQDDVENAMHHYQEALRIQPGYADAHYNLALLFQNTGDLFAAVRHWRQYLKLDTGSPWAQIARRELAKLEAATVLPGSRTPRPALRVVKDTQV